MLLIIIQVAPRYHIFTPLSMIHDTIRISQINRGLNERSREENQPNVHDTLTTTTEIQNTQNIIYHLFFTRYIIYLPPREDT